MIRAGYEIYNYFSTIQAPKEYYNRFRRWMKNCVYSFDQAKNCMALVLASFFSTLTVKLMSMVDVTNHVALYMIWIYYYYADPHTIFLIEIIAGTVGPALIILLVTAIICCICVRKIVYRKRVAFVNINT